MHGIDEVNEELEIIMNYKLSVITPFHNVDMGMFGKCAESMRRQTIGFENIEWIIVVHNSEPQYMSLLTEMFKDDSNVVVKELRDKFRTPATPRNYGMELVTTPYVGFLDGDDSYTHDCLEVVRREMIETQAQVVTFRREYELETESLHPHTETVLWNQMEWRIVLDRENFRMEEMFSGLWPFSTSRLFDVEFLRKNNIRYSEEVPWLEDVWHTGICLMKADRVCYLPQFIGYHYFINGGSIIQNLKQPMEVLQDYFRSYVMILDKLTELGIDTNDTSQTMLGLLRRHYLASDLTAEQRHTLCDMVEPYLKRLYKMTPNKLHSPEECYLSYHLSKEVLSNWENPQESPMLKDELNGWSHMMEILRNNSSTDYGKHYHFDKIETLEDYQQLVPLSDYENYQRLINLQTNIGESGILTTAPMQQYLVNAKGQRIPCTEEHLRPYMETLATTLNGHHNLLVAIVGPRMKQTNDGCTVETLESQMVKKYMWYYHYARGKCRAEFSMPDDLFFKTQEREEMQTICYYALLDGNIDQIVAVNTQRVADMFSYITEHREELLRMVRGKNAQRAEDVEKAFLSDKPLAKALWPKLQRIVAFGAGEYYEATARMKEFTGKIPHNHGYYYTEETIYGHAVADDCDLFEGFTSGSFHEFLPLKENEAKTVLYTNTQKEMPYQLVVTNKAGLYRYITDHVVCIQDVEMEKIRFTIY